MICYTDADLSANLAQLGALAARIVSAGGVVAALGQRYGIDDAVLIRDDGPTTEPHSTGDKPDKPSKPAVELKGGVGSAGPLIQPAKKE